MSDREYFTLVFKGDITKIQGNPMKIETIYGVPVASGMGNAFDALDDPDVIVQTVNNHDALVEALRAFVVHATYPVSTEINPRGYAWRGEEALDYAKSLAEAALAAVSTSGEQS